MEDRYRGPRALLRAAPRTAVFFGLFTATGLLARNSVTAGGPTALIWPAAGIAALWLGTAGRHWLIDVLGLVAATIVVNGLTGASFSTVLVLIAANLVGAATFVGWARRSAGHLWGLGGEDPLARLADLGHLVIASVIAGLTAALTGWSGFLVTQGASGTDLLVWWCRCAIGTLVVVSLAILALQPVLTLGYRRWTSTIHRASGSWTAARLAEAAALVVVSAVLLTITITDPKLDSLVYVLVLTSVWAGLRFRPVLAMIHAMVLGWAILVATVLDHGPFTADGQSETGQAMLAQGFLAVVAVTALVLALGRSDLDRTSKALAVALAEASARTALLDMVLSTMREGLTVVDDQGQIHLYNPSLVRLLDLSPTDPDLATSELAVSHLFHPDGRPVTADELPAFRALAGEEVTGTDFHVRSPGATHGRIVEIGAQVLPGTDRQGYRRAVVNVRDVTADRQHRDALAHFAGTAAHDLYTPLTMINGWSETLVDAFECGRVDPDLGILAARRIHASAQHMRDVIRDLLAYAVARDQSLHLEPTDVSLLVEHLAELNQNSASAPCISVQPGIVVQGDRVLLRQLAENLIGNAVKYATPGLQPRIDVTARQVEDGVEVRVSDNGVGIDPSEREEVFAPYHRVDDTGRGTGLGLAICWRIVDRHGGRIWIEDGPGGTGTTVVIQLAAARGHLQRSDLPADPRTPDTAA